MAHPEDDSQPRMAIGCRVTGSKSDELIVLFPEGAIRIKSTGRDILQRCDGKRTFAEIVRELQGLYASSDREKIRRETCDFLQRLQQKRIVDF